MTRRTRSVVLSAFLGSIAGSSLAASDALGRLITHPIYVLLVGLTATFATAANIIGDPLGFIVAVSVVLLAFYLVHQYTTEAAQYKYPVTLDSILGVEEDEDTEDEEDDDR